MALTTYSNALSLLKLTQQLDAEQLGYVDTILRGARIAQLLPIVPPAKFMEDEFYERKQHATSIIQGRALNQNPAPAHVNRYEKKVEQTILMGGAAEIDHFELQAKPNELDRRVQDLLFDLGFWLDYKIINGDADTANGAEFSGLKARLTGNQLVDPGSKLQITSSVANFRTFMSKFRIAKRRIKRAPGQTIVALISETMYEAVQGGRDLMGANVLGSAHLDILNETVETLDGTPLVMVRTDDVGNEILPMTEGGGTDTGSIYLIAAGGLPGDGSLEIPNGVVALSQGGVAMTPEVEGNMRRVTVDYNYGIRVPDKSACRLSNLAP
jgi:hypothetical protein